jgi:hypothetical protein
MKYNISLSVIVDPDAPFLESDRETNTTVLRDLVWNAIYDIDDIEILEIEVDDD